MRLAIILILLTLAAVVDVVVVSAYMFQTVPASTPRPGAVTTLQYTKVQQMNPQVATGGIQ